MAMNLEKEIRCKCGVVMPEEEFSSHFKKCTDFKKGFRKFDESFSNLLKTFSEPKDNLLILRFLLRQYIVVLTKKIKAHFIEINNVSPTNKLNKVKHKDKPEDAIVDNKNNSNNIGPSNNNNNKNECDYARPFSSIVPSNNRHNHKLKETCPVCNKEQDKICPLECCHFICPHCFEEQARKDIPNMICTLCKKENKPNCNITERDKREILGQKLYDSLYEIINLSLFGDLVECPKCHEKNSFEKGKVDYNIRDENNKVLRKIAAEHYAENRCRCLNCQTIFCITCKLIPYHIGKTCEEYKNFLSSNRCRYDNTIITDITRGPNEITCKNSECLTKYKLSCKKVLKCGHHCYGYKKETTCPPCLNRECPEYKNIFDQDTESFCNICFIEGLGNAPVVQLSCNHFIHFKCLEKRLKKKWTGPKITFGHCLCPMCNKWLDCPNVPVIQHLIDTNKALYDKISKMALERLKFEGLDKDKRLTDPNSKWYGNELAYALNRITYYMCYECKEPYFAGLRECGEGPNVNQNDPNKVYDPKDCICGKHANMFGVAGISECKIHGKEFIEYKCRFCCKIASWFCWGTTHFCDDCHTRQCNGDYVSKYPAELLPVCDPEHCEVKVKHPPNGEEFALGCRVCRIEGANVQNF